MLKKYLVTSILAAGALLATSLVHAVPIVVSLQLVEDSDPSLVFFYGSATTADVTAADITAGFVGVDSIVFTDVTEDLPAGPPSWVTPANVNAFGNFSTGDFTSITAFLNATGTEVIGFEGTAGSNVAGSSLLLLPASPATDPIFRWEVANSDGLIRNGESGLQQIPEPTSIALLGIGLLGLGFAGRKKLVN